VNPKTPGRNKRNVVRLEVKFTTKRVKGSPERKEKTRYEKRNKKSRFSIREKGVFRREGKSGE